MDPIPELQAHGSGPGYRDVLWVEARSFPSLQYGNKGIRILPEGMSQGNSTMKSRCLGLILLATSLWKPCF